MGESYVNKQGFLCIKNPFSGKEFPIVEYDKIVPDAAVLVANSYKMWATLSVVIHALEVLIEESDNVKVQNDLFRMQNVCIDAVKESSKKFNEIA